MTCLPWILLAAMGGALIGFFIACLCVMAGRDRGTE